jgi:hypothetical protein
LNKDRVEGNRSSSPDPLPVPSKKTKNTNADADKDKDTDKDKRKKNTYIPTPHPHPPQADPTTATTGSSEIPADPLGLEMIRSLLAEPPSNLVPLDVDIIPPKSQPIMGNKG